MVENMDHAQDVERLFSWFKAPMVHYREFGSRVEIAEAVAAWPLMHQAAVAAGVAAPDEPGPQGSAAAHERIARERMTMPAPTAQPIAETSLRAAPAADRPVAELAERLRGERAEPTAEPAPAPSPEARWRAAPPVMTGFEEPAATPPPPTAAAVQAGERGALFGGEYRARERPVRPGAAVADRQDRSLEAVFSRLSGGRDRLPDPRDRARTTPGLGSVFGRMR